VIKALSISLGKYPGLNTCLEPGGGALLQHHSHNIGVAMATSNGLVVPNIKQVRTVACSCTGVVGGMRGRAVESPEGQPAASSRPQAEEACWDCLWWFFIKVSCLLRVLRMSFQPDGAELVGCFKGPPKADGVGWCPIGCPRQIKLDNIS